jgi:hypothetical protein
MTASDVIQIVLMGLLVIVTGIYAWRTHVMSSAAKKQAEASVKMAEEMREQRIIASRPVIISRAVYEGVTYRGFVPDIKIGWTGIIRGTGSHFSHFEVYNAGSGPAIDVEISILDEEKHHIDSLDSTRRTLLKTDDPPLDFYPSVPSEGDALYYVACEYQSITSRSSQKQTWYQTLLPFKPSKSSKAGGIYVATGELEFKEVTEKERINAFRSGSKPK